MEWETSINVGFELLVFIKWCYRGMNLLSGLSMRDQDPLVLQHQRERSSELGNAFGT